MINWMKKKVATIYIKHQLKKLGITNSHRLKTLSEAGADVYVIYQLLVKLWASHGEKLTQLFNEQTSKIINTDDKLEEINKCLTNIKNANKNQNQ